MFTLTFHLDVRPSFPCAFVSSPVAEQRGQHHQAVLHHGDLLRRVGPFQQQFPSGPEGGEAERLAAPLRHHVLQLGLNVALLHSADANILEDAGKQSSVLSHRAVLPPKLRLVRNFLQK